MTVDQTFVVIGAGQAGGWTAKTLRDEGFDGRIILIGDENFPPHERPPLSKEVLLGEPARDLCLLWPSETLDEAEIEMRLGVRVTKIIPDIHELTLQSGETVHWDKLMIATGGRATTLPVEGADLDGVFTLRTIDDAETIHSRITGDATVLVIGAGWIGLEVAAAARKQGAPTIIIELADRVCARALTPDMSQWIHDLHVRNGVDIRCGVSFSHFKGNGGLKHAVLSDGSIIECDIAVVGIGLTPNTELASAAGLETDNGIVVDEQCRTSHPDIYAAGDNARHPNPFLGRHIRLESWENAQNQAICAAKAMLGGEETYAEIPWFWSDQYGANIQMMGLPKEWNETAVRGNREKGEFVEFYLKDGKLEGAAAINNPRDLRFTRRMMMSDRIFSASDLADPDIKLQKLLKG
ncbi:MAG: Rhodocoxin reductase [Alphaproteobacteria bacterium MarineAlpha11_Bin1]|nr:MAG: Rhodocoxin reductase [Alphaproteobacteria bacterium MarineAlpha11_Bin1]|tara:strand:- start:303 stop:1529 length:1227 start_codon:yes stop_codon:yes gene_type:complete